MELARTQTAGQQERTDALQLENPSTEVGPEGTAVRKSAPDALEVVDLDEMLISTEVAVYEHQKGASVSLPSHRSLVQSEWGNRCCLHDFAGLWAVSRT